MTKLTKEDIGILEIAVHVLNPMWEKPGITQEPLDGGYSVYDEVCGTIYKLFMSDKIKTGTFVPGSGVGEVLRGYRDQHFMQMSQTLAELLFCVMKGNADVPPAYLYIVRFAAAGRHYIGILKQNYKAGRILRIEEGVPRMDVIRGSMTKGGGLSEAAVIELQSMEIRLTEKKYEVNGEKVFYFSGLFLQCDTRPSEAAKLKMVLLALDDCIEGEEKRSQHEILRRKLAVRAWMEKQLSEEGKIVIQKIPEGMSGAEQIAFREKMERRGLWEEAIEPLQEPTTKALYQIQLKTWQGMEVRIPERLLGRMKIKEELDGSISLLLEGIESIQLNQ